MTVWPDIPVAHHVYGSAPGGFTTLEAPPQLDRAEILAIERRCGYALPPGMISRPHTTAPVKRTYFSMGDWVVVGRAVDAGIDVTGRTGNYVSRNILLPRDAAQGAFTDPVALTIAVEEAGLFDAGAASSAEDQPIASVPSALHVAPADLSDDAAHALLTFCLEWKPALFPALTSGDDIGLLGILAAILPSLPPALRWSLPFDSYVYGADPREMAFAGLPQAPEFSAGITAWTLRIDTTSGACDWRRQLPDPPIAAYLTRLRNAPELLRESMTSCMDLIELGRWEEVPENLAQVDRDGVQALVSKYREPILAHLGLTGDAGLFTHVVDDLTDADLDRLGRSASFGPLAGTGEAEAAIVSAALRVGPSSSLLPWILRDQALLARFLEQLGRVPGQRQRFDYLERMWALLPDGDSGPERLVVGATSAASLMGPAEARIATPLIRAIRSLPATGDPDLASSRLFVLHQLGDGAALREFLSNEAIALPTLAQRPGLLLSVLRSLLKNGADVGDEVGMLADACSFGRLPPAELVSACCTLAADEGLDPGVRKRFVKSARRSVDRAPDAAWKAELLACLTEGSSDSRGLWPRRRDTR